jgi:hypothetical protein
MILVLAPLASTDVIYVLTGASGSNDGTSWADAYDDLQDAIADANLTTGADLICVAEGTYYPGVSRTDKFVVSAGISVVGGYDALNSDDWRTPTGNPEMTVLSGEIGTSSPLDNSEIVTEVIGTSGSAALRRVRITGAYDKTGIYVLNNGTSSVSSNVSLADVFVDSCVSTTAPFSGGVTIVNGTSYSSSQKNYVNVLRLKISSCQTYSSSPFGGGMSVSCVESINDSVVDLRMQNVVIQNCQAGEVSDGRGGGLYFNGGNSKSVLQNILVSGNVAEIGGGIYLLGVDTTSTTGNAMDLMMYGVTCADNEAESDVGHEVYCANALFFANAHAEFVNSVFWNSRSVGSTIAVAFGSTALLSFSHPLIKGGRPANSALLAGSVLTSDPLFNTGVYTLSSSSPAKNSGGDSGTTGVASDVDVYDLDKDLNTTERCSLDLAMNPRFVGTIDLGSYEVQ